MGKAEHPTQPLVVDDCGVLRYKRNAIVRWLLDAGPFDMNIIAVTPFTDEDRRQFAQLIGALPDDQPDSKTDAQNLGLISKAAVLARLREAADLDGYERFDLLREYIRELEAGRE